MKSFQSKQVKLSDIIIPIQTGFQVRERLNQIQKATTILYR